MNETLKTLLQHRTIRKYSDQPISDQDLELILKAASSGSTMGGMQLYSIIVTRDKEKMKEMAPFHFNQPMATQSPLILTFCADFNRFNKYCSFRDADTTAYNNVQAYHWAIMDAMIATQNACVADESLGLGICWLGTVIYNADKFVDYLKLPAGVVPLVSITVGHPVEKPEPPYKLPLEAVVHYEEYQDYNEQSINRLYKEVESHPQTLQLLEENQLPNLARIITEKRYKKEDNLYFTTVINQVLKKQGFL